MTKRIISILVLLCLVMGVFAVLPLSIGAEEEWSAWDGSSYDVSFFNDGTGEGTEAKPYKIASAAQWVGFVKWSNKEITSGVPALNDWYYFELTANLKFNEGNAAEWAAGTATPANTSLEPAFDEEKSGKWGIKFNGNGHTVSGVYMNKGVAIGLFGNLWGERDNAATTSVIENLILENSYFTGAGWVGSVLGETAGSTLLKNLYVAEDVYVNSTGNVSGGIVAGCYHTGPYLVTFDSCVFAGTLTSTGNNNGGIIGNGNSSKNKLHNILIENCMVLGEIKNGTQSSGFVGGNNNSATTTIRNSIYAGKGFGNYPFGQGTASDSVFKVENSYTTAWGLNGAAYITKSSTESTGGVTLVTAAAIYGTYPAVGVIEGFTTRDKDVMIPNGIKALESLNAGLTVPSSSYYDSMGEDDKITVQWKNGDTILETDECLPGTPAEYNGATPEKAPYQSYGYVFTGWDMAFDSATGAVVYSATFKIDAYIISSVEDWMTLLSGQNVAEVAQIEVKAKELDFTGKDVKPIDGFAGTFNGNGVIIKNVNMVTDGETGLFHCIEDPAIIENLVIVDSYFEGSEWVGSVVCCAGNGGAESPVIIRNVYVGKNVTVKATMEGNKGCTGGILGGAAAEGGVTVSDCVFEGTVSGASESARYLAGIAGNVNEKKNVRINNCLFTGTVTNAAPEYSGGIADGNGAEGTLISNCMSFGTVPNTEYAVSNKVDSFNCVSVLANVYGTYPKMGAVEGFTARDKDVMIPNGVKALETLNDSFTVPSSNLYDSLGEDDKYTVQWKNGETVLETDECLPGEQPEYNGATPEKAPYQNFTYVFTGWDISIIPEDGSVIYSAKFTLNENTDVGEDTSDAENTDTDSTDTESGSTDTETAVPVPGEDKGISPAVIIIAAVAVVAVAAAVVVIIMKKKNTK